MSFRCRYLIGILRQITDALRQDKYRKHLHE